MSRVIFQAFNGEAKSEINKANIYHSVRKLLRPYMYPRLRLRCHVSGKGDNALQVWIVYLFQASSVQWSFFEEKCVKISFEQALSRRQNVLNTGRDSTWTGTSGCWQSIGNKSKNVKYSNKK